MTAFDFGPFLLLSDKDNVLVARANAPEGLVVTLESGPTALTRAIPMAHKIARRSIAEGDTILKYGIATAALAAGEHVHIHNIRSAYTATISLQDADGVSAGVSL